jgi:cell division protein FtsA
MRKRIAAIDIGTSKICTVLATLDASCNARIQGVGVSHARGIEKGLLVDLLPARQAIQESIRKAEGMAGHRVDSCYIAINGNHVHSMNQTRNFALSKTDQLVHPEDLKGILDMALNIKVLADQKLLQFVPSSYTVYGREIKNRSNSHSYNLDIESGFINQSVFSVQLLNKCMQGLGIETESLILENVAAAEGVLTEEEKQNGTMLIDIGADTTSISILMHGKIQRTGVIQVGGKLISSDIAAGLGLSYEKAEEIKKTCGAVSAAGIEKDDNIQIDGDQAISRQDLCEIMGARVEEIMRLIMLEVPDQEYPSGVVLAGGSARLPGLVEMAQDITQLPVRIGSPSFLNLNPEAPLNDPAFATAAGLIRMKTRNWNSRQHVPEANGIHGLIGSVSRLFQ